MKRFTLLLVVLALGLGGCSHTNTLSTMFGLPGAPPEPVLVLKQPREIAYDLPRSADGQKARRLELEQDQRIELRSDTDRDSDGVYDIVDECPATPGDVSVDSFGCPVPLFMKMSVTYEMNQVQADEQMLTRLERIGRLLQQNPRSMAVVEGHTDDLGDETTNLELSKQRAQGIKILLTQMYGIDPARIKAAGYGESQPLVSNSTENGRNRNRRVDLSLKGYYRSETSYVALHRPYNIHFETAHTYLSDEFRHKLDDLGLYLSEHADTKAMIDGYTDNQGPSGINMQISLQRAEAVKQYLEQNHGIAPERLNWQGHGERSPIASNESENGRAKNRRVTVTVTRSVQDTMEPGSFSARLSREGRIDTATYTPLEQQMTITFKAGNETLDSLSRSRIDKLGLMLQKSPKLQLTIEGHASSTQSRAEAMQLSRMRAERVKSYLQQRYDISANRLHTMGFGPDMPFADAGQTNNERVQIKVNRF